MRIDYLGIESMLKTQGFNNKTLKQSQWKKWQEAYPEIVSSLVFIYRENDRDQDAELILTEWVSRNPSDNNAKKILDEVRSGR